MCRLLGRGLARDPRKTLRGGHRCGTTLVLGMYPDVERDPHGVLDLGGTNLGWTACEVQFGGDACAAGLVSTIRGAARERRNYLRIRDGSAHVIG